MNPSYTISKSVAQQRRPQSQLRIQTMVNTEQRMKQAQSAKITARKFFVDTILQEANEDYKNTSMTSMKEDLELQLQQFRNNMRLKTQEFNYNYDYENKNNSYQLNATSGFIQMLIEQIYDYKTQLKRTKDEYAILKELHDCDVEKFSKLQSQYIVLKNKHFTFATAKEAFISKYEKFDPNQAIQSFSRPISPSGTTETISKMTMLDFISTKDENESLRGKVKALEQQIQAIQQTLQTFNQLKQENQELKQFMNEIELNTDMSKEYIKDLISSQKNYKQKVVDREKEIEELNKYIKQIQNESNRLQQQIFDQKQIIYNQGIKVQQFDQMEKKVTSYDDIVDSNKQLIKIIDKQESENNQLYLKNKMILHKLDKLQEEFQESENRHQLILKRISRQLINISQEQIIELRNRADRIEAKSIEIVQDLNNYSQELNNALFSII